MNISCILCISGTSYKWVRNLKLESTNSIKRVELTKICSLPHEYFPPAPLPGWRYDTFILLVSQCSTHVIFVHSLSLYLA